MRDPAFSLEVTLPHFDNEEFRFGSAEFASESDIRRAGMFNSTGDALFLGFAGKRPLWYRDAGGLLLIAGARGGKLSTVLSYNLCHSIASQISLVVLDLKGELAAISQDQTPDRKPCIYWNPASLHTLPQNRINPVDYINAKSPTLVSDTKVFCENILPETGSANGEYFEQRAREYLEAIILTEVKLSGILTLPRLYHIVNLIPGNSEEWLKFAFEMHKSGIPIAVRVEEEIAVARDDSGGGFKGIMGEIFKAFSCLSDPLLMESVSPPFDFSFADLCSSDKRYQVYLMPPEEFVRAWSPILKSMFVAGMIYKSRKPSAPRQTWILDECAQLGRFPLLVKLFTYGAGIGIRPWAIYQTASQMLKTAQGADSIITSSAAVRSYFSIRDYPSAQTISKMLGDQTLEYDDELKQAQSELARKQALRSVIQGRDPFEAGLDYAHHKQAADHRSKMRRALRDPNEVLNTPPEKQYIFCGNLDKPIYADRRPYFNETFMAGRFLPNPYHPPADRVRVKGRIGHHWLRVVREPVPTEFAQFPQYRDGYWSRLKR